MEQPEIVELELFLVRHGQSLGNIGADASQSGFHPDDPPLTDKGLCQARLLGEYYKNTPFDCVLSSGLTRAVQTAAQVVGRNPAAEKKLEIHPVFTECGVKPEYGFQSMAEVRSVCPFAVPAAGLSEKDNYVFCSADDGDEQRFARAKEALGYLRGRFHNGERVMVVGHAAFNTILIFAALGLGTQEIFDVAINNTGVTKIAFFKAGTGPYHADVHMVFHNSCAHLAGTFDEELIGTVK